MRGVCFLFGWFFVCYCKEDNIIDAHLWHSSFRRNNSAFSGFGSAGKHKAPRFVLEEKLCFFIGS